MSHFLINLTLHWHYPLAHHPASFVLKLSQGTDAVRAILVNAHWNALKKVPMGNKYLSLSACYNFIRSLNSFWEAKRLSWFRKHTNSPPCTNKHTPNAHLTSTSLFPKGSKRNQPSNRGVLCKQAKGISTCGKMSKQEYSTRQGVLWWEILYLTSG